MAVDHYSNLVKAKQTFVESFIYNVYYHHNHTASPRYSSICFHCLSNRKLGDPLDEIVTISVHRYSVIMPRHNVTWWHHLIRDVAKTLATLFQLLFLDKLQIRLDFKVIRKLVVFWTLKNFNQTVCDIKLKRSTHIICLTTSEKR